MTDGSRAMTSPMVPDRLADRATAAELAWNPSSSASSRTFRRVSELTPGRPFSAYDTEALEIASRRAMSLIVTRSARFVVTGSDASAPRAVRVRDDRVEDRGDDGDDQRAEDGVPEEVVDVERQVQDAGEPGRQLEHQRVDDEQEQPESQHDHR